MNPAYVPTEFIPGRGVLIRATSMPVVGLELPSA
jgi:hypothetical protein